MIFKIYIYKVVVVGWLMRRSWRFKRYQDEVGRKGNPEDLIPNSNRPSRTTLVPFTLMAF